MALSSAEKRVATKDDVVVVPQTPALHPLIARRRSPRALGGELPDAALARMLEAARWAPSAGNGQPWAFVVVRREDAAAHAKASALLMGRNGLWAPRAPVMVAAIARVVRE